MRTNTFCSVLLVVPADIYEVDACCYKHTPRSKFVDNTRHSTSKRDIGRKSRVLPHLAPHGNIATRFGGLQLERCGYPTMKKFENTRVVP